MKVSQTDSLPDELCSPPGFIEDLVQHMDETAERRCPELFLAAALCALSVIVGRKVQDYRGTRPNIYTVSLGTTGAGKNHPRMKLKELFLGTHLEGPSKFTSESAIATALEVSASRLFQIDEFGDYVSLACNDKASGPLKTAITGLTEIFTASAVRWSPNAHANSRNDHEIVQPNLVIHGTTNADDLFCGLTPKQVSSGFVGRLLVFLSPNGGRNVRRKPFEVLPIPKCVTNFIEAWKQQACGSSDLSEFNPDPRKIPIAADALQRINDHIDGIDERGEDEERNANALWSRAAEKTSKLALLAACSRSAEVIEMMDMNWAIAVTNFLTRRLVALVHNNVAGSDHERKIQRLLRSVVDGGGVLSLAELSRKTQWLPLRERKLIVMQMMEAGTLIDVYKKTTTQPARGVAVNSAAVVNTNWSEITAADIEQIGAANPSRNRLKDSMKN